MYNYSEWDRVFKTPSQKLEFFSRKLFEAKGLRNSENQDDLNFLPHYLPSSLSGDKEEYPFYLNVYSVLPLFGEGNPNQPWLKDISGSKIMEKWDGWVELSPQKAKELGISNGDWVWVESERGKLKLKARLFPGSRPEVVSVPFGFGHTQGEVGQRRRRKYRRGGSEEI